MQQKKIADKMLEQADPHGTWGGRTLMAWDVPKDPSLVPDSCVRQPRVLRRHRTPLYKAVPDRESLTATGSDRVLWVPVATPDPVPV
ncbi:hypothetical protein ACXKGW_29325, partial [Klebsiella pneumoniae subsp. pneumoniae]